MLFLFSFLWNVILVLIFNTCTGADPGFQVRGVNLKKSRRAEGGVKNHDFTTKNCIFSNCGGRRENFWGISCEKSRFYAKKSYFFQLWREARKFLGYFVWKITILRQKILFFSNFRGPPPPLGSAPGREPSCLCNLSLNKNQHSIYLILVLGNSLYVYIYIYIFKQGYLGTSFQAINGMHRLHVDGFK